MTTDSNSPLIDPAGVSAGPPVRPAKAPISPNGDPQPAGDHKTQNDAGNGEKDSQTGGQLTTINSSSDTRFDSAPSMLKKDIPNVLPLHLAPIDSFFLADDKPRYPMTSVIRLAFAGRIDPEAFNIALDEATERHPLTSAVIRPAKRGLPCWVRDRNIRPWVDWGQLDKPIEYPQQEAFDLANECGLRFWVRGDDQQTIITVQVHHACTDGTGVYRFLGDLFAIYGQHDINPDRPLPELSEVDPRMLRQRRSRLLGMEKDAGRLARIRHSLAHAYRIFGKRITPLATPHEVNGSAKMLTPFPGVVSYQFSKAEHKQLREASAKYGAMLNDLLMAEMFRTIVRWNELKGVRPKNSWLRVMMPSDLREQCDYPMPATNMTAYTFITRRLASCNNVEGLIKNIREETARIKHDQLGRGFMDTIDTASGAASILKYLLQRDRCIATTILSNVGDPSKRFTASLPRDGGRIVCGNMVLEDVSGVPPMRIQSHATLAVFSYLRKLTISVRCDPYRFTPEDAKEFLDVYAGALRSHIA